MRTFELASMFTDHMVLQQMTRVPVWGSGPEGGSVTVEFKVQTVSTIVQNGSCWELWLEPLHPGGPYELKVYFDQGEMILRDVWVGEVWLAGGQSNMVQQLLFTEGGVEEADQTELASMPQIRFFTTPRRPNPGAQIPGWDFIGTFTGTANWQLCTPANALHFSAIGYYFGKFLACARQVPIGIISCNFGATPIEAWMSERYLERDPDLKRKLDDYKRVERQMDPVDYEGDWNSYLQKIRRWQEQRGDLEQRIRSMGLAGYRSWVAENPLEWTNYPLGPKAPQRPSGLYHSMLHTVIPFAIRGVIWYQGESNCSLEEAFVYRNWLQALIENWREDWNDLELPFLVAQLTSFASVGDPTGYIWSVLRESQESAVRSMSNTALAVTLDCGEAHDIHPVRKQPIAERLALAALAVAYGEAVDWQAPHYHSMAKVDSYVHISFNNLGEGLTALAEPLLGFEICGEDHRFVPAQARIVGDQVEVSSVDVPEPLAVRYAWSHMPVCSLAGKNGLPVAPFRTDDFAMPW
jgi:sialate O-acetylesterase